MTFWREGRQFDQSKGGRSYSRWLNRTERAGVWLDRVAGSISS
jgi:hypothetical protein